MKNNKMNFLIVSFLILGFIGLLSINLSAAEPDMNFYSLRERAMGGAGVAISEDFDALIINPACLTELKGPKLHLLSLYTNVSTDTIDNQKIIKDLNVDDKEKLSATIKVLVPSNVGLGINPDLGIAWKGFGIGAFVNSNINMNLARKTNPKITLSGGGDAAAIIGLTYPLEVLGGKVAGGLNIKYVKRYQVTDANFNAGSFVYGLDDIINMADRKPTMNYYDVGGLSCDLGFLTALETPFGSGKAGFVIKDFANSLTGYNVLKADKTETKTDTTRRIPTSATIGFGVNTSLPPIPVIGFFLTDLTVAFDYNVLSTNSFYKNLHFGVEKRFLADIIKFRGGLNQGYFVGGLGLDLGPAHLHYAYHKEALGYAVGSQEVSYHLVGLGLYF